MLDDVAGNVDLYKDVYSKFSRDLFKIAINEVSELIECVANTRSIVTACGDSNISRELVARSVHVQSSRCNNNFVSINCAAIPKTLIEGELFGYKYGSSAGSRNGRSGHIELANNGTLFLDEIDGLDSETQQKLLATLQEGTIRRIGSDETKKFDVRFIVGTRHNLYELTRAGNFREDLFYRINIFPIHIPSLRRRVEDLPLFVDAITSKIKKQRECKLAVNLEVRETLLQCLWPGKSYEYSELLERASILYPYRDLKLSDGSENRNVWSQNA
jgi:transcriptional regulator with GAF, ATPase, and Fis domain